MEKLTQFKSIVAKLASLNYTNSLLHWDDATIATKAAIDTRSKAMSYLAGEQFTLFMSDETKSLIKSLDENQDQLDEITKKQIEVLKEELFKYENVSKEDFQAFVEIKAKANHAWEEAREKKDFSIFAPHLEKVVAYTKKFAKLRNPEAHPYNTLLDDYEKGLTIEALDEFFSALKATIVPLLKKIQESGKEIRTDFLTRTYPANIQEEVSIDLLKLIHFDLDKGVLAESTHPFTLKLSNNDVRLTTHYYENNFVSSIFSSIHEGGHGIYEQNIASKLENTMLNSGVSMGIHESQSRFYENILGRSLAFWKFYYPKLQEAFKEQLEDVTLEEFYLAINKAEASFIRTESDELTYNLHIMIRYELERDLLEDKIQVKDLPKLWNKKYEEYLGITPKDDLEGVLQDVHWSSGLIGYFPSYALGNANSAQITHRMKQDLDLDQLCLEGNLKPIQEWLSTNIHQYGQLKTPNEILKDVTGALLDPKYFTEYIEDKYNSIYFND